MRGIVVALVCAFSAGAWGADKTPYAMARLPETFKEDVKTVVHFETKADQPMQLAGMCVGQGCDMEDNSVGYWKATGDGMVLAPSQREYALKEDSIVGLTYTVLNDSTVHKRFFRLVKNAESKSGYSFKLDSEPEIEVVKPNENVPAPAAAATPADSEGAVKVQITSYDQLIASLKASGPDANANGIADHLDVCYYGFQPGQAGNCSNYARRAVDFCRGWGLKANVILQNVYAWQYVWNGRYSQLQYAPLLHAKVRVWIGEVYHDFEPQLGGGGLTPSDTTITYDNY